MNLSEIVNANVGGISALVVFLVLSLIQVSKIKINPWSWIARRFGNAINQGVYEKIGEVENRISDVEKSISEVQKTQESDRKASEKNVAITSRVRILRFNEELLRNQKHSKESFDQALSDITDYERYCDDNPDFENERAVMAIQNIERCYQKCLEDRDFL